MKKNVKKWLISVMVACTALFAVVASGCSAGDKLDTWYNQLTCEHAKVEKVVGKDATCTEDGYTEYEVCKDCDKELGKKVIKATGHENITVIEGYAATCTTTGKTDGEYCNDCKKTVVEQKTIYALGHKKTYARAEKETCTTDGHTAGWICGNDGCNYVYSGYELIPATGHDYVDKICENCGEGHTIALTDVTVGTDLTGYTLRLTISEEEFAEKFYEHIFTDDNGWGLSGYGDNASDYDQITFAESGNPFLQFESSGVFIVNSTSGTPVVSKLFSAAMNGSGFSSDEEYVFGSDFSAVVVALSGMTPVVEEFPDRGGIYSYFEFYYVGLPETDNEATPAATNDVETTAVSYAMNKRAMPALEELQYELIVTDKNSDGWTGIF